MPAKVSGFEVFHRDGAGRVGRWLVEGRPLTTPLLISAATSSFPPFEASEACIVSGDSEAPAGERVIFRDGGSIFSPIDYRDGGIPPDYPIPPGFRPLGTVDPAHAPAQTPSRFFVYRPGGPEPPAQAECVVLGHGSALVWRGTAGAEALMAARRAAGYRRLLYIPATGAPVSYALLVYLGADLFDTVPLIMAAQRGLMLTTDGMAEADDERIATCPCRACSAFGNRNPAIQNPKTKIECVSLHNHLAAYAEIACVRRRLRDGTLRELVEARSAADPLQAALLRRFDRERMFLEERAPVSRPGGRTLAVTRQSLTRPEFVRFRRRFIERYRPPPSARILLLLPCSAKKPYFSSLSHSRFRRAVAASGAGALVHQAVVTSPLGIVPRELELFYPAQNYDITVTGRWDGFERAFVAAAFRALIKAGEYGAVVVHLAEREVRQFHLERFAEVETTGGSRPASSASLAKLTKALRAAAASIPQSEIQNLKSKIQNPKSASYRSLARFQFGEPGWNCFGGVQTRRGRGGTVMVFKGSEHVASIPPNRGMFSLTLAGGEHLLEAGRDYTVEIDDFRPSGSVFAVGVKSADPQIRPGDEVVAVHNGEVRGVGVAVMSGPEMVEMKRGEAVRLRHHR